MKNPAARNEKTEKGKQKVFQKRDKSGKFGADIGFAFGIAKNIQKYGIKNGPGNKGFLDLAMEEIDSKLDDMEYKEYLRLKIKYENRTF